MTNLVLLMPPQLLAEAQVWLKFAPVSVFSSFY